MNVVSLFSGIGGFDEGFRRAGFDVLAACEINADCRKVLTRHFPETEIYEDVKTITGETFAGRAVDVLVGGFPCQDLSVAGKRAGLAGERSGLWFEFVRIIGDYLPRWVVIENVPGLLSSNGGADFAVILRGLVELGYGVAWRILDAQYFGLAQRRQRVFIVASRGSGRAAEVLFEREGGGWNPAPRREAGERFAATLTAGVAGSRGVNAPGRRRKDDINPVAGTVSSKWAKGTGGPAGDECYNLIACREIAGPLVASGRGTERAGDSRGQDTLIAHTLRGEGHDASEDGTGRGTPLIAAFTQNTRDEVRYINGDGSIAGALRSEPGMKQQTYITAFTERSRAEGRTLETQEELACSLTDASKGGNPHSGKIAGHFGVRRLMPVECEALQGFPRNWTATDADGDPISDSARYRMLGNAVAVPCAEWIARRIMAMGGTA